MSIEEVIRILDPGNVATTDFFTVLKACEVAVATLRAQKTLAKPIDGNTQQHYKGRIGERFAVVVFALRFY